jgi:pimeloyl-ACP methyl ester carboxylesterase
VTAAVLQAGVLDLRLGAEQGLGNGAVGEFLGGGPDQHPQRYAVADPVRLLPTGVPVLCVHGSSDVVVPVQQSRRYATAAEAVGDRVEVRVLPGDHMTVIDPASDAWTTVRDWMRRGRSAGRDRTTLET